MNSAFASMLYAAEGDRIDGDTMVRRRTSDVVTKSVQRGFRSGMGGIDGDHSLGGHAGFKFIDDL